MMGSENDNDDWRGMTKRKERKGQENQGPLRNHTDRNPIASKYREKKLKRKTMKMGGRGRGIPQKERRKEQENQEEKERKSKRRTEER